MHGSSLQGTASCMLLFMLSEAAALYVGTHIAMHPVTMQPNVVQVQPIYMFCSVHPAQPTPCSFINKLLRCLSACQRNLVSCHSAGVYNVFAFCKTDL